MHMKELLKTISSCCVSCYLCLHEVNSAYCYLPVYLLHTDASKWHTYIHVCLYIPLNLALCTLVLTKRNNKPVFPFQFMVFRKKIISLHSRSLDFKFALWYDSISWEVTYSAPWEMTLYFQQLLLGHGQDDKYIPQYISLLWGTELFPYSAIRYHTV